MEKYCTAGQPTDENIIRRMRFEYWIFNARDTHSEYVVFILHGRNSYANAPQYLFYMYLDFLVME